ncbi:MAG: radical SAM protein, partial [Acidobacteria bacterium]|nr:radical SAM protein [Acidobacteriota bacterium]
KLSAAGYTEIQLLGQNVNSFRAPDSDPSRPLGSDFAELLRRVGQVPGIRRVRFMTSHPRDFVRDIVDAIDENPVLCNHVHLPVQSGSTAVLKAMQRQYTRDEYLRRIDWMKSTRRELTLTSDIIVGFPGETEQDLQDTLSLLSEVEYDAIFAFKYSKRPNTPALALEDHITEEEKSRRLLMVQEHQRAIQIRRNARHVGRTEEVMVEGFNKATNQWLGKTTQLKTITFAAPGELAGEYRRVMVTRAGPAALAGELVQ